MGKRESNPGVFIAFLINDNPDKTRKKTHKTRAFATVQPWDFLLSVAANMFKL